MDSYQEDTYGDRIAGVYDEWYTEYDEAAVATLKELAQGRRALELGIGTGRIALPLQESGVEVHGIDASEAMVSRLRSKPGGESIPVTIGNFAGVPVEGKFNLVYVLANTFYALLTQEEQLQCFQNVAAHLAPEGVFAIEAFVPKLDLYNRGQNIRALQFQLDEVKLDVSQIDPVNQEISSQHMVFSEQGVRFYPVKLRYVWPAEFDLMARIAGMQLKHRWSNWQKAAFSSHSDKHISVFSLP